MALVVTARASVEAQPHLAAPVARERLHGAFAIAALVAALFYGLAMVCDSLVPFAVPGSDLELALQGIGLLALAVTIGLAVFAWIVQRQDTSILLAATLAAVLAPARLVLADVLQTLDLRALADVADTALGLLTFSCLAWAAAASWSSPIARGIRLSTADEWFRRVAAVGALMIFGLALSGATVRAVGASWACQGTFPDCNGLGVLPFGRDPLADIQLYHRLLAYVTAGFVLWLAIEALRSHRRLMAAAGALLGATLVQSVIGVASISSANPPLTQALHTGGSALTLGAAITLVVFAGRGMLVRAHAKATEHGSPGVIAAYIQLTKPGVMSLLLATTATSMIVAARGFPDLGIFFATLLGGALMSGGAGAINHFVDRDIDPLMGRTAWRPIPSGVISPVRALGFGILLAVLASAVFLVFVNPLACLLALVGLLGYVFIYTLWLKRSTPSNIVIGGAAGAIPPLVGWAAVTNEVSSLTVWYLFAIIFFWTPPHFWALSLLIRQHYERAGVPMLPVVRGDEETRRQIVLYSILLVVLTLVLTPFGLMGGIYFAAALILGGIFVRDAIRLWRVGTREAARGLYLFSLLYLFLLFAAMAVDRSVMV